MLFGIGPAKISPIYPPAGIAVAATFIFGPRVLPAVFVGQFFNGFPLLADPNTTLPMYALANTGTGVGSILEALIAVALLRRFAGTWHPFDRPRHVVIFLLGSVPRGGARLRHDRHALALGRRLRAGHELEITFVTFFLADAAGHRGVRRAGARLVPRAAARPGYRDKLGA